VRGERTDLRQVVRGQLVEVELDRKALLEHQDDLYHAEGIDQAFEQQIERRRHLTRSQPARRELLVHALEDEITYRGSRRGGHHSAWSMNSRALRSRFPFAFSGSSLTRRTSRGTMYSGSRAESARRRPILSSDVSAMKATIPAAPDGVSGHPTVIASACASSRRTASTSSSSTRCPRILIWLSSRPRYSSGAPALARTTRSPVR